MTTHPFRRLPALAGVLLATALTFVVAACGSDSSSSGSDAGNGTDVAFIDEMTPHHQSAIDMTKIADRRGKSGFVKRLATGIDKAQSSEIATMRNIRSRLSGVQKTELGMSMGDMGMNMDDAMLNTATPFDRAFVDMMIPHHQGAIRMARVELANGKNGQLRTLATSIVAAQSREISAMNDFRTRTYGAPSPAGGVPKVGASGMPGMNH